MNTLTLSTGTRMAPGDYYRALEPALAQPRPVIKQLPTWLPAPAAVRVAPRFRRPVSPARKIRDFRFQQVALLLLAAVGVVGIVYGFSHLLDLVQHWAVFNAGLGRLIP